LNNQNKKKSFFGFSGVIKILVLFTTVYWNFDFVHKFATQKYIFVINLNNRVELILFFRSFMLY